MPDDETDNHPTAAHVDALVAEVRGLRDAAHALARRTSRNEWALTLTVLGLVVDVALSVVAFVLLGNQAAVTEATRAQQAQIVTSQKTATDNRALGLCPIYALLISGYSTARRDAYPAGPAAYDAAFAAMRSGAAALRCAR